MDKDIFKVIRNNGELPDFHTVDLSTIVEDIWEAYIESSISLLNELEAAAMAFESGQNVEEDAAATRRTLHTLKGEAGMTGFMDLHNLCHEAETAFEDMAQQGCAADMVLRVKDWMMSAIEYAATAERGVDAVFNLEDPDAKGKIKALCIEDDLLCQKRLDMILSDFCQCDFADNGRLGFEKFKHSLESGPQYELITLDIQMPEWDGHETLKHIREYEAQKGILGLDGVKVIMLTSQGTPEHIFSSFREGCEAYVFKSFMGEKLLDEMTKLNLLRSRTQYSLR